MAIALANCAFGDALRDFPLHRPSQCSGGSSGYCIVRRSYSLVSCGDGGYSALSFASFVLGGLLFRVGCRIYPMMYLIVSHMFRGMFCEGLANLPRDICRD
jgi:hypothetical protein